MTNGGRVEFTLDELMTIIEDLMRTDQLAGGRRDSTTSCSTPM